MIQTVHFLRLLYRNETVAFESYEPSLDTSDVKLNYSSLYNAMIYPFTCMAIYGVIWYQGEE